VFTDKAAIVTGGASGIGRALGAELFGQGAHVVLADVDGEAAARAAAEIGAGVAAPAGSIVGAQVDVRESGTVRSLVDDVAARHGRLDLMFNNAGISMGGTTHEMGEAAWNRIIDINLRGVVNGVLAAYPRMVAQASGHIVNTASGAGLAAPAFLVAYATTKHAIVGLSTGLRPEAAHYGVRVSVLCPGAIDTPILDRGLPDDLPPEAQAFQFLTGREYLKKVGLRPMPVDRFARRALREVARNKAIIVVPGSAKALWYAHRLSPGLTERAARLTIRRILRARS
jgi:NAD(P)-dependent dehydrogenase (short-subunit alcohol dehydrogenase family)